MNDEGLPEAAFRESRYFFPTICVFALGLALHIFLASRSWVAGDQIHLLNLGLEFSLHHHLRPFAKMMSGAGSNPGVLLQLLVGVPLVFLPHYQSPMIGIVFSHIIAGLLFIQVMLNGFGNRGAFFATVVYWLSPWRLYNSGFLWEPSFIFLPAALHLWASWRSRKTAGFMASFLLVLSLLMAAQIHNSAFILFLLTAFLLITRKIRVQALGAAAGFVAGSVTLVPTVMAILGKTLPATRESEGFIGNGLVLVYPVFKGVLYWFTLGALDLVRPLNETVFLDQSWIASNPAGAYARLAIRLLQLFCILSVGVSIYASWWFFRPMVWNQPQTDENSTWFRSYAAMSFVSLVVAAGFSPIVLQGWQVVVALHAACIPVVVWASRDWYQPARSLKRGLLAAYIAMEIILILSVGFGLSIFRKQDSLPAGIEPTSELATLFPHTINSNPQ